MLTIMRIYITILLYFIMCIYIYMYQFSSVQSLSRVWLFTTPWTAAHQASVSITNSRSLPKLMSIELVMPSNHLICIPFSSRLQLSQHLRLFKWVSSLHKVAKILEFHLQHQSFQWTPRTDFLYVGLVGSPCSARDSQESSLTPQFKSINSPTLGFLYGLHISWLQSPSAVILEPPKNKLKED